MWRGLFACQQNFLEAAPGCGYHVHNGLPPETYKGGRTMAKEYAESKYFSVLPGVELHYWEQGEGKPLVFIPGLTFSGEIFKAQIEHFSKNYRVHRNRPARAGLFRQNRRRQRLPDAWTRPRRTDGRARPGGRGAHRLEAPETWMPGAIYSSSAGKSCARPCL